MGVGRRMKKQGPPQPLSEEHFAKLKRKAGLPVDAAAEAPEKKKRRTTTTTKTSKPVDPKGIAKKAAKTNGSKAVKAAAPVPKTNGRVKKSKPAPVVEEEDGSDEDVDDEFDVADLDDLSGEEGGEAGLKDDFLDDDSVFDSEEEHKDGKGQTMWSEDEDESDAEEKLTAANIEGLTRKLDAQMAEDAAGADAEMAEDALQTNIDGDKPHILQDEDSDDELAAKTSALLAPDLQLLRTRITENIRVLDDFSHLAEDGRSRAEYTAQLLKDVCAYYGYSEYLAEKLFNLFTPREAFAFFEANESPRPVVIRTNTLRTHRRDLAQALINRGVTLEPVGKWSKVGLQIFESNVPLGATPEYLAGHYILQAASSFLPCMALDPQENERVLDMAAAPGGKTTYMAAMMKNTGFIMANDPNKARAKGLIGNIHRLGARNVIVSNHDARDFPKPMGGFDRVLLDAPCSGTGVIAKDPSVKTNKTERDFMQLPHIQKQLLLSAIDSVNHASKTGGYVVYSTCSVTVEENEAVVQYALSRRPNVRLVDSGLAFGKEGFVSFMGKSFDPSVRLTRRYYPHTYNVDGFFVAKFQKFAPTPAKAVAANANHAGRRPSSASKLDSSEEVVDRTPIVDEDAEDADEFGGWDEEEDKEYMEKGRRNAMRRRGMDPRSDEKKAKADAKSEVKSKVKGAKGEAKGEAKSETEGEAKSEPKTKTKSKSKSKKSSKKEKA